MFSVACSRLKGCPSIFASKCSVNSGDSQAPSSIRLSEPGGSSEAPAAPGCFVECDSLIFFLRGLSLKFVAVRQNLSGGSRGPCPLRAVGSGRMFLHFASWRVEMIIINDNIGNNK